MRFSVAPQLRFPSIEMDIALDVPPVSQKLTLTPPKPPTGAARL
jgi:hypothetical protein